MGHLFSSFLLPLVSGFILSISILPLRFYSLRVSGYFFILQCTVIGTFLVLIGDMTANCLRDIFSEENLSYPLLKILTAKLLYPIWGFFRNPWHSMGDNGGITDGSAMAFILAISGSTFSLILEFFSPYRIRSFLRSRAEKLVVQQGGGQLEKLLYNSINISQPVKIVLKSRKIYIGYILSIDFNNPLHSRRTFNILPISSGYRDEESLKSKMTKNGFYTLAARVITHFDNDPTSDCVSVVYKETTRYITRSDSNDFRKRAGVSMFWDEIESVSSWIPEIGKEDISVN